MIVNKIIQPKSDLIDIEKQGKAKTTCGGTGNNC
jgi:hypothetical protein